jgi:hypothetical protein
MTIKTFVQVKALKMPDHRPKAPIIPRTIKVQPPSLLFGVLVEDVSPAIVAAITRDLIALLSTLTAGGRIQLVSPNLEELRTFLSSALPIDFVSVPFEECSTWKGYWASSKPEIPPEVRCTFWNRVYTPTRKKIVLKPNQHAPSLPLFDVPRLAPVGLSPNTRRMPAPPPNNAPSPVPGLYPWLG